MRQAEVVISPTNPNWLALGVCLLLVGLLLRRLRETMGTTLWAAGIWALVAAMALAGLALMRAVEPVWPASARSALSFIAATSTFCPIMAVLGAKRPQHYGWQWVVASLWLVVSLPALQTLLLPAGPRLELFVAWKLFVVGLIGLGLLNYLPTSNWGAALSVAVGQWLLLDEFLGLWQWIAAEATMLWASCAFLLAALFGSGKLNYRFVEPSSPSDPIEAYQQIWRDFRNAYGSFWSLRVMGRVNESAERGNWPVLLTWSGFVWKVPEREKKLSTREMADIDQALANLLRRFV